MRMSIVDRILLVVLCLCGVAVSVAGALTMLRVIPLTDLIAFLQALYDNLLYTALVIVAALLVAIICIKLLFSGTAPKTPQNALIKTTENGAVRISISALDAMAQKHVRQNEKVRDVKSSVVIVENGIRFRLRISLMPESIIPEVTAQLQTTLKDYVEGLSGINVKEVLVFVEDMGNAPKPRVE